LEWAKAILEQEDVQIIHAHFGPNGVHALPLRQELGIPLITTFYGYDLAPALREVPQWEAQRQRLFQQGDLFLVEGPFMRDRLIALGCPADKVQIQRIAIAVSKMPYHERYPRSNDRIRIVFAGRFCKKKGLLYALDAIRKLWTTTKNIEFRVIGNGELLNEVKAFVNNHGLAECVKLLGFLQHQEYLGEMQRGDIFLHPSIRTDDGDSEGGAPTTILEAQALGMPVVSTVHADIPNVTVPGGSAILVPERDSDSLAQALQGLLRRPEQWREMGRVGRAFMERNHDIAAEARLLEQKYQCVASTPGAFAGRPCSFLNVN
jgi:colanic acid/amylovoran biosynthesis glycosyltransferase